MHPNFSTEWGESLAGTGIAQRLFFYWNCHKRVTFCFSCEGPWPGGDHRPYAAPFLHPGHLTGCVHCAVLSRTQASEAHGASALPRLTPPTHTEASPQAWPAGHWWWVSMKENVCNPFFYVVKTLINKYWCIFFFSCVLLKNNNNKKKSPTWDKPAGTWGAANVSSTSAAKCQANSCSTK